MKHFFGTILPVGLLTCLIWLYADQLNTETSVERITLTIAVPKGSGLIPSIVEPHTQGRDIELEVELSGQRGKLEKFSKELGNATVSPLYMLKKDASGVVELDAREVIAELIPSRFGAIRVLKATPESVKIAIDREITVDMTIKVLVGTIEANQAQTDPVQVKVTLPKSFYNSLPEERRLIQIDVQEAVRNMAVEQNLDVMFDIPQSIEGTVVKTEPKRVRVQLQLQNQLKNRTFTFSSEEVQVMTFPVLMDQHIVTIEQKTFSVTFRGPASVMGDLKKEDIVPYIQVEEADKDYVQFFPRDVTFILPKRIEKDNEPEVSLKLVDRSAEPETPE